ncbi:translation initiation factor IF-2 [uncultured Desulfovibrio sp.]|uniref:translation initiation factor IF-2 n=1 Tax=uncultured Desulfovibrio sp. TaxID=167968 RepID=UPI0028045778|nr:translation initiation factor IF-2 [uncultured Desulfovibrio sp.]
MSLFGWVAAGAVMFAALIFCFRLMRHGLRTLDDDRRKFLARIRTGERQLEEERKQVPAAEHMALMRAGVEDLLRLADSPPGYCIEATPGALLLHTPTGTWRMELSMRERSLHTAHRVLHGRSRWFLSGFGHQERHDDLGSLMGSLHAHLRADTEVSDEPAHLARRLGASRGTPAARAGGWRPRGQR